MKAISMTPILRASLAVIALWLTSLAQAQVTERSHATVSGALTPTAAGTLEGPTYKLESIVGQGMPAEDSAGETTGVRHGWSIPPILPRLYRFALEAGWSLRGAPGISDHTIEHIFSGAAGAPIKVGKIHYPTRSGDAIEAEDTDPLLDKRAFWVFSYWGGSGREFATPDADRPGPDTHWIDDLDEGWNLYSPPYSITVPRAGILGAVWRWNNPAGAYQLILPGDMLTPLEGYWVFKAPATR